MPPPAAPGSPPRLVDSPGVAKNIADFPDGRSLPNSNKQGRHERFGALGRGLDGLERPRYRSPIARGLGHSQALGLALSQLRKVRELNGREWSLIGESVHADHHVLAGLQLLLESKGALGNPLLKVAPLDGGRSIA